MKIELKNIKTCAFASQETNAFEAKLYVDGKCVGIASNEGHGGPNWVQAINRQKVQEAEEYAKSLPPHKFNGTDLPMNLDFLLGLMVEEHLGRKDLERMLKRRIVVTHKGEKGLWEFKQDKGSPYHLIEICRMLRQKHSNIDKILNELPFDEAYAIYKSATELN